MAWHRPAPGGWDGRWCRASWPKHSWRVVTHITLAQPGPAASIGVGTWAWGNQLLWGYDPAQDQQLQATFARAVELGLNFFDTADSYGTGRLQGRSEELLGRFAAALPPATRQRLCLATKLAPFPWRLGRRGYERAFAASRQRLGGEVDRVQLHWSTARYAPWQEGPLLEGLADLVLRGDAASLGLSNMGPRRLRTVHAQLRQRGVAIASLQVQLSLLAPEAIAPGGVAEVCRELGIALIAYSPLALGLLARRPGGALDAGTGPAPVGPRRLLFARLLPQIQPLLALLAEIADQRQASPAHVALNWCRSHGAMPIVGLRSVAQAEQAAAALQWSLATPERQALDAATAELKARMPGNPFVSR
ncbi:MAG: aldo/keto reductase [Cyanobacteria bacterium K_DeepCast_35m_m2_023]|nr:aldo/keto reductase [Cyanobacteria bacterium K_DeepCast_35m_m2_023]